MALFSAAAKGDVLKIQSLIDSEDKSEDSGGVDVNCSDASGKTPSTLLRKTDICKRLNGLPIMEQK